MEDGGELLGHSAAVTVMLDRLLHHGHLLKWGLPSWRTKTDLPDQVKLSVPVPIATKALPQSAGGHLPNRGVLGGHRRSR